MYIVQPHSQAASPLPPLSLGERPLIPGCGWSHDHPETGWSKKNGRQAGWQSVLIAAVTNIVGFKSSSSC